jgi:hypothetical protein|tara:strand:+ start:3246 stop:4013 length:768 start_codon:yes stop_codon:yes gene_type:complete
MEILKLNNIPSLKENEMIIPLFTLDSLLLPGDEMIMRVFEPRYKQMLDDISLDNLPYGHVMSNPAMPDINGWLVPYDVGTLVQVNNLEEQGTNLLYGAKGGRRFRILSLIEPALTPEPFDAIFPSVDELMEQYIEQAPSGKLYVRAVIETIPELKGVIDSEKWEGLLLLWRAYIENIAEINEMNVNEFDIDNEIKNMFPDANYDSIWKLASLIIDSIEDQIKALKASDINELSSIIESSIQKKLNMIRLFRESNE